MNTAAASQKAIEIARKHLGLSGQRAREAGGYILRAEALVRRLEQPEYTRYLNHTLRERIEHISHQYEAIAYDIACLPEAAKPTVEMGLNRNELREFPLEIDDECARLKGMASSIRQAASNKPKNKPGGKLYQKKIIVRRAAELWVRYKGKNPGWYTDPFERFLEALFDHTGWKHTGKKYAKKWPEAIKQVKASF